MVHADEYQDGGTVSCVLVDTRGDTLRGGIVGYADRYGGIYPKHCFIGADYPRMSGAYLLPLWGPEERTFVSLVHSILIQGLTPQQIDSLGPNRWPLGSHDIVGETGSLAKEVERRYRTHVALDRGYLADPRDALAHFELTPPVRLAAAVSRDREGAFALGVEDRMGKKFVLSFPSEADSLGPSGSGSGEYRYPLGTNDIRLSMALAAFVLDESPGGGGSPAARQLRSCLAHWRTSILRNDRVRDGTYDHGLNK